jgi:hypothetical protein
VLLCAIALIRQKIAIVYDTSITKKKRISALGIKSLLVKKFSAVEVGILNA